MGNPFQLQELPDIGAMLPKILLKSPTAPLASDRPKQKDKRQMITTSRGFFDLRYK